MHTLIIYPFFFFTQICFSTAIFLGGIFHIWGNLPFLDFFFQFLAPKNFRDYCPTRSGWKKGLGLGTLFWGSPPKFGGLAKKFFLMLSQNKKILGFFLRNFF